MMDDTDTRFAIRSSIFVSVRLSAPNWQHPIRMSSRSFGQLSHLIDHGCVKRFCWGQIGPVEFKNCLSFLKRPVGGDSEL